MPPNGKADLAHPEAADWVMGTLGPAQAEDFQRHLTDCPHCQAAVGEFGELGQMLQHLPPAAEPPPGLEARTIASVLAAAAKYPDPEADRRSDPEDQAATRVQPRPQLQPPAGDETRIQPRPQLQPPAGDETQIRPRPQLQPPAGDETQIQPRPQLQPPAGDETQIQPRPQLQPPAGDETRIRPRPQLQPPAGDETRIQPRPQLQPPAKPQSRPEVTRLPVWRRYRGRLAAVAAAAAAIITAAIVIPLSLGGGRITPTTATVVIPLHATTAAKLIGDGAATGRATARQADQSWTFTLNVHGLKPLPGNDFYECWWVTPGHTRLLATGGSFVVGNSGSTTVTMTTGVDPTQQFTTMEITAESPSKDGALNGPILLIS